ncbi:unnamed protein product [Diatraea saccharalis]|uniref:Uncharacterized protein n=1 Tax=Diatraea saccharalis TaxID=40085 RepID=A0A9N9R439_9NEOP|nr:unnamed protein product [Diatraea saccharalis]
MGTADGIGGSIKRLADHFVASGHDIVDASQFFDAVNNRSKIKTYCPLPKHEAEVDISTSDREEPLTDITNIIGSTEGFYKTVYTSTSEDEDDQPLLSLRKSVHTKPGVAKSGVDEDGDVKVMFYKSVDDTGKMFKLVETDVSDVMYENLFQIIPPPKLIKRGKRVFYEYNQPIEVFEK